MFDPDDYELHEAQKHACKMAKERDEARVMVDRLTAELAKCAAVLGPVKDELTQLRTALAESQAREAKLREALEIIAGKRPCYDVLLGNADLAHLVLTYPTDDTALREMIAEEREACTKLRAFVASDATALSYQTLGQYRTELLRL